MNILCVDDDPIILQFLEEALKKCDLPHYELRTAMSGNEAIDIVLKLPIDLIILDYKLPDITGLETLRRIKITRPRTEIMMITGYASIESAVEAMKAGARDYVEKPFALDLLREKVLNIIELRRRESEAEEYRYAKEVMEAGAQRAIVSLESAIDLMKQCQARVTAIIDSDRCNAEKVTLIRREINDFARDCT